MPFLSAAILGSLENGWSKMEDSLLSTLPGTRDLLPDEVARWQFVEERARQLFARYSFREIRTPMFEATELFARGIGADTDIVGKEMSETHHCIFGDVIDFLGADVAGHDDEAIPETEVHATAGLEFSAFQNL